MLYAVNWSRGADGWSLPGGWTTFDGTLLNDSGTSLDPICPANWIAAPWEAGATANYAVDVVLSVNRPISDLYLPDSFATIVVRSGYYLIISVVGAVRIPIDSVLDRAMFGYFASKDAAERIMADSLHDRMFKTVHQMTRMPLIPVPAGFRFQPVDPGEVAARLVELALGAPAGLAPAYGGPRVYAMAELIRGDLQASHRRRPILPVWLPGKAARAFRAGATLAPDRAVGHRTWEEFLATRVSAPSDSRSDAATRSAVGI